MSVFVRRRPMFVLALGFPLLLAACGEGGAPTIESEGDGVSSTSTPASTSSSTATTIAGPAVESQTLALTLTGDVEVPGPGSDGTAEATLTYDGDQLCLRGTTDGVGALTAGHVHAAPAGAAGPPVVDFLLQTDGDGPFEGCAAVGAEGGVVFTDPGAYYVNLHTAEHPDGAVRAQLG